MQIEDYLKSDDRCVVPLGSTEQHAYLSLSTDSILSEKVAVDAAAPLGIPVFPAVPYGLAHHWTAFPGTGSRAGGDIQIFVPGRRRFDGPLRFGGKLL